MIVTPSGRFPSFLDRPIGSFCAGILALPNDLQTSGTVTSHVKHSPRFHGMIVTPSGRFPSFLDRPRGSFCAGILALPNDLQTTSLSMLLRRCFPFPLLQTSPWSPFASTISRQWWHKCCSQSVVPNLSPTAIRTSSSERRRPKAVTGGANIQSPQWGAPEASRRAGSRGALVDSSKPAHTLSVYRRSHSFWRWAAVPVGGSAFVKVIHPFRALLTSSYGVSQDSFGKMHVCSSVVLAAEARKAESASVEAQRTPRPPSLTGKDAWSQRSSSKSTFRMVVKPSLSKSSNLAKLGQSAQTAVRILNISFGTLKLFLSRTRASCV